jgi:hypothetical protein
VPMYKLPSLVLSYGPTYDFLCQVIDDLTSWWQTPIRKLIYIRY